MSAKAGLFYENPTSVQAAWWDGTTDNAKAIGEFLRGRRCGSVQLVNRLYIDEQGESQWRTWLEFKKNGEVHKMFPENWVVIQNLNVTFLSDNEFHQRYSEGGR